MDNADLAKIVIDAQQGNTEAQKALYLETYRPVYFLAYKMLGNEADAEDMTQNVFITAYEKLPELKEPASFRRWLNLICANKCKNILSRNRLVLSDTEEQPGTMLEEDDKMLLPEGSLDDAETRKMIMDVIEKLPTNQKLCIFMYYYEQLTIGQIAEILECSEGTVKSRLSLARGKIRDELESIEKKQGIKLYGIPLVLMPILQNAAKEFMVPQGVAETIWQGVQGSTVISPASGIAAGGTQMAQNAGATAQASADTATQAGAATESTAGLAGGGAKAATTFSAGVKAAIAGGVILLAGGAVALALMLGNAGNNAAVESNPATSLPSTSVAASSIVTSTSEESTDAITAELAQLYNGEYSPEAIAAFKALIPEFEAANFDKIFELMQDPALISHCREWMAMTDISNIDVHKFSYYDFDTSSYIVWEFLGVVYDEKYQFEMNWFRPQLDSTIISAKITVRDGEYMETRRQKTELGKLEASEYGFDFFVNTGGITGTMEGETQEWDNGEMWLRRAERGTLEDGDWVGTVQYEEQLMDTPGNRASYGWGGTSYPHEERGTFETVTWEKEAENGATAPQTHGLGMFSFLPIENYTEQVEQNRAFFAAIK